MLRLHVVGSGALKTLRSKLWMTSGRQGDGHDGHDGHGHDGAVVQMPHQNKKAFRWSLFHRDVGLQFIARLMVSIWWCKRVRSKQNRKLLGRLAYFVKVQRFGKCFTGLVFIRSLLHEVRRKRCIFLVFCVKKRQENAKGCRGMKPFQTTRCDAMCEYCINLHHTVRLWQSKADVGFVYFVPLQNPSVVDLTLVLSISSLGSPRDFWWQFSSSVAWFACSF